MKSLNICAWKDVCEIKCHFLSNQLKAIFYFKLETKFRNVRFIKVHLHELITILEYKCKYDTADVCIEIMRIDCFKDLEALAYDEGVQ